MLVEITGKRNEEVLTVSSRDVARDFEKEHKNILRDIESIKAQNCAVTKMFIESSYKAGTGKNYKEYFLTRDGFTLLAMGFTGEKALGWKLKYIEAFNAMERELKRLYEERKQWEIERAKGVLVRHILTDTIKMKVAESPNKRFVYPNYTKLIYKTIFNKPLSELKEEYKIKPKESLRDYLTGEQLKEVEQMEMLISSLINLGMGYEEIKSFIREKYIKTLIA